MVLYGRDLSPFVRRVAVWCALYGHAPERRALAATEASDKEAIRAVHPGIRVPALALDDGTVLIDSAAICDWLDETAPGDARLVPAAGADRRACLQRMALAQATAEKLVALVYERNRRPEALHWAEWQERLADQVRGGFGAMEQATPEAGFLGGEAPDGSDLVAGITVQFAEATNPWLLEPGYPRLAALTERLMALPAFADTRPG